jgi:hypothetical protein
MSIGRRVRWTGSGHNVLCPYGTNRNRFVGDDGAVGSVDPFAVVGEAGVGADGADKAASGGLDVLRALDDESEGGAAFALAKSKEAEGVSMAVDESAVGEVVMFADLVGAAPMEEVLLDPVAVRMAADDAVATATSLSFDSPVWSQADPSPQKNVFSDAPPSTLPPSEKH